MARIVQAGAETIRERCGGTGMEEATIVFSGTLDPEAFAAFARHRARRLAIDLRLDALGTNAATVVVAGAPDLVDAFEMACSLGPATCIVRDVTRLAGAASESLGPTERAGRASPLSLAERGRG